MIINYYLEFLFDQKLLLRMNGKNIDIKFLNQNYLYKFTENIVINDWKKIAKIIGKY